MKQSGFILISTLFFSFVLTTLLTLLCTHITADIQSRKNEISDYREFESAKISPSTKKEMEQKYILELLFQDSGAKKQLRLTFLQYEDMGIPDFESLSHATSLCEEGMSASLTSTINGTRLTPSAFLSSHTCTDMSISQGENIYFLTSNIELQQFNPDPPSNDEEFVLVSTGYLAIAQMTVRAKKLSLFAAGDIFITALEVPAHTLLSLYSSSGVIVLQQVDGAGEIEALAKEGIYAPAARGVRKLKSSQHLRSTLLLGLQEHALDNT